MHGVRRDAAGQRGRADRRRQGAARAPGALRDRPHRARGDQGGRHAGEDALDCARRESREEAGVVAACWRSLGVTYEIPSVVQGAGGTVSRRAPHALTAARPKRSSGSTIVRMSFADALEACADGRIIRRRDRDRAAACAASSGATRMKKKANDLATRLRERALKFPGAWEVTLGRYLRERSARRSCAIGSRKATGSSPPRSSPRSSTAARSV